MIYTGSGGRPAQRPASTTDARHRHEEKVAAAKAQADAAVCGHPNHGADDHTCAPFRAPDLDAKVLIAKTPLVAELIEARAALARVEALADEWDVKAEEHVSRAASGDCPLNEALIQTGCGGGRANCATDLRAALRTPDTEGGA